MKRRPPALPDFGLLGRGRNPSSSSVRAKGAPANRSERTSLIFELRQQRWCSQGSAPWLRRCAKAPADKGETETGEVRPSILPSPSFEILGASFIGSATMALHIRGGREPELMRPNDWRKGRRSRVGSRLGPRSTGRGGRRTARARARSDASQPCRRSQAPSEKDRLWSRPARVDRATDRRQGDRGRRCRRPGIRGRRSGRRGLADEAAARQRMLSWGW